MIERMISMIDPTIRLIHAARMLPPIPKFGGSGCLSTDLSLAMSISYQRVR